MAALAQQDQAKRTVHVNRLELYEILCTNREKHVADYAEAMAGYKAILLARIEEAFKDARQQLDTTYANVKAKVAAFTDADIEKQRDSVQLINGITVDMKVPRSYEKEYDAAIAMTQWDVREMLELTHAEFTCFVRDQWDWKSGFDAVALLYKTMS